VRMILMPHPGSHTYWRLLPAGSLEKSTLARALLTHKW